MGHCSSGEKDIDTTDTKKIKHLQHDKVKFPFAGNTSHSVNYSYIQIWNHVQTAERCTEPKRPDKRHWLPTNVVLKLTDAYL